VAEGAVLLEDGAALLGEVSHIFCGMVCDGFSHRRRREEVHEGGDFLCCEFGEGGHAAFAVVDEGGDLGVSHLVTDTDERREGGKVAFAIVTVADGAVIGVGGGAGLLIGLSLYR
jgi:hypothetical protein